MKGFALGLALKQRQKVTRKLPIICAGGLLENYKSLLRPPAQVLDLLDTVFILLHARTK